MPQRIKASSLNVWLLKALSLRDSDFFALISQKHGPLSLLSLDQFISKL